ncbi:MULTISPECIES: LysR family transcriptional regulator [Cyanophyceae]|uniref:LysR family transcriptional regulator n=1 Tax=Cyanophyceae TaxID=3028117 RepID=UPI001684C580|nr:MULTISPECIES: LysR family transcriptional regulator [Cyanophyceae]MBD1915636.1 LysR family transcriptional regulator [Phormidium sp. FACHB-77]MBD2031946.1 LysR family transcriptional regulator [Phormidium sp. FACHB-322]MBD2050696.1 LysR family transcriptional regulator [Leptolyngbya sp. FACHB-60]
MINLGAVDLNLLVAFEALYAEKSVTAAAQRLHVGQPAMSAALGRLRSLFSDDLFVRVGREMRPTAKANAIAPQVAAALDTIRATLAEPQSFAPASSQRVFTLATSDYFASLILPKLLVALKQQAPHIDLRLITVEKESFIELIESEIIDLALGTFANLPSHILEEKLLAERFLGVCRLSHPASENGKVSLEQFVAFPHALFTLRRDATGIVDQILAEQGLQRRVALTVPYWLALPTAIATSDLIAAIPSCLEQHFLQYYPLQVFELPLEVPNWVVSMAWSKLSDRDAANLWLRQIIREVCQAMEL